MLSKIALAGALLAALSSATLAKTEPTTPEPSVKKTEPAPKAPAAGAVTGTISYRGDAEPVAPVDMASDPFCVGAHEGGFSRTKTVVSADGGLKDVFVNLTDGVPDERYKAPKEPVELDQKGCTYEPHVFGIVKKQDIKIINSDDTLHNIHAVPRANKEFNVGMPNKGMTIEKTFKKAEDAIAIKCDVHPWMKTWCFSMEHPYFGVTDAGGNFSIDTGELPDGEYGVRVWHEVLGEATGTVEIKDGKGEFKLTMGEGA